MAQSAPAKLYAARPVKLFNIGQVLNVLNPDFPDLTPSKLRFLEEQGLVTPQRTPSGYRKFTQLDIERIQIVLELQRDQYLPLKVIRNYLADLDEGKQPSLPGGTVNPQHLRQSRGKKLTRIELIAETAITPALIEDGTLVPLDEWIAADPDRALDGADRLPFLLKILAAAKPLSLQAHPSRAQAQAGFARENSAGIPLDSPIRNYRDDEHKPELIVALSEESIALSGFRDRKSVV